MKTPTIYQALRDKLKREPTNEEIKADCLRILREGAQEINQRKRRVNS